MKKKRLTEKEILDLMKKYCRNCKRFYDCDNMGNQYNCLPNGHKEYEKGEFEHF